MSAEIEIVKQLASFTILLISITIPTYAIAASLIGKEFGKTLSNIKKEKQKAEEELAIKSKAAPSVKLEDYEKTVEKFREKEREIKNHLKPLSLWRIVVLPNAFFGLAFIISNLAILFYPRSIVELIFLVASLIIVGLIIYGWVLDGIYKIAEKLEEEIE
jgi:hypothetical protein